jgi:ABC-type sugar transport system substrate-binding protein
MPFFNAAVAFLQARNGFFGTITAAIEKKAKKLGART